ncbi:MAG: formylmethanofuran dehydrogenase subunit E family protein [Thermodesulfobacteriota bacterium]|nr:formylmethanofuran dehydrogenase subunit E family protein [Thermodesulfobacteriota bacterium]
MEIQKIKRIRGNNEMGTYTIEEYMARIKDFHGSTAPGLVIGGFMVHHALGHLPDGEFFDALCETASCLPDAVQLLMPCTTGNGWMKVIDLSRFAITLYNKYTGIGIRVHLDAKKLENWPEIKSWFFRLKPKKEQNFQRLMDQIIEAGTSLFGTKTVQVKPELTALTSLGSKTALCTSCGEAFKVVDGPVCPACRGNSPYTRLSSFYGRAD